MLLEPRPKRPIGTRSARTERVKERFAISRCAMEIVHVMATECEKATGYVKAPFVTGIVRAKFNPARVTGPVMAKAEWNDACRNPTAPETKTSTANVRPTCSGENRSGFKNKHSGNAFGMKGSAMAIVKRPNADACPRTCRPKPNV